MIFLPSDRIRSVAQSCLTLCNPMNHRSTPGLPVHHQLPEFTETHVHRVSDAIQPSHPLSSPSPPANAGDPGLIPGSGRSSGEGHGNPLQYSCLETPMDPRHAGFPRGDAKSLQSCLTLCNPIDGSPPGSPVPGILQARVLEWVAISFSRGSSRPRVQTQVSHIVGRRFTV